MIFENNVFDEIHCVHALEHVTRDKHIPMLSEMYRVLKPGGKGAFIEVPDFIKIINNLSNAARINDVYKVHVWTTSVYGKNERPGMAHHWGFTHDLLLKKMRESGFNWNTILYNREDMISSHYKQEPVLLMKGTK